LLFNDVVTKHSIQSDPLPPKRWDAELQLEFSQSPHAIKTLLSRRDHTGPLLVQKALYPEGDHVCHAVILHPPAGIAGGDHLKIGIKAQAQTQAVVTTPGATKWYKSNGLLATQTTEIVLDTGAHLDFLPQENIYFNQSNAHNSISIEQAQDSSMIGWDIAQLGRRASGETWTSAFLHHALQLQFAGRLFWVEASSLDSADQGLVSGCKLGHFPVMGTMWLCGTGASEGLLEAIRELLVWTDVLRVGATRMNLDTKNGLIVVRGLSTEVEYVKDFFIHLWLRFRFEISGIAPLALRLWKT
jgi:urease accessory protein